MKKIFEVYAYIFFRLTNYREKKISNDNSAFSAILILSLTFFLYFLLIRGGIQKTYGITLISNTYLFNKIFAFFLLNIVLVVHWYLFFKITNYEELKQKYLNSNEGYKTKGILVFVYVIAPFFLSALTLFILANTSS